MDASNVPGYTWQYKGQPTLNKYRNFMLFVDHNTKLVYPSFQETKTGEEACRSKRDYEAFAKRYNIDIDKYHTDNGAFRTAHSRKKLTSKARN
jgi:chloramphenicol O-acetyltransferase